MPKVSLRDIKRSVRIRDKYIIVIPANAKPDDDISIKVKYAEQIMDILSAAWYVNQYCFDVTVPEKYRKAGREKLRNTIEAFNA